MKKQVALIVAALMLGLSGCAPKPFDGAALEAEAVRLAAAMRAGDYAAVEASFASSLQKQLTAESLGSSFEAVTAPLGSFSAAEPRGFEAGDSYYVEVFGYYEKNGTDMIFTFDRKNKVTSLYITYRPLPHAAADSESATEIEITLDDGTGHPLGGFLTLPKGAEKPPVVLLVQGSGSTDRDETIGAAGNKPFRDIALGLAARGIASLRYDKRYFAYPELGLREPYSLTIDGEVLGDVALALDLLRGDGRVGGIWVMGHSLGGMLAPYIAQQNPDIRGIISVAGTPRSLQEVIYDQNIAAMDAMPALTAEQRRQNISYLDDQLRRIADLKDAKVNAKYLGIPASYWVSLHKTVGRDILPVLTVPVLALQGEVDFQVSPARDFELYREIAAAGRPNIEAIRYPGLNHLMMPTAGRADITEYDAPAAVSEQVIADMADFVLRHS